LKKIAPSILSADFGKLTEEIKKVESAGADWIHVDVMDGRFVPNITIGPPVIKSIRKASQLPFDVHLMIENPEWHIDSFAAAGSDLITVHAEAVRHLHRVVHQIKELGIKAGVSRFGGQKFISSMIDKIEKARTLIDALPVGPLVEIDGGVTTENIEILSHAGADVFVAGSSVFNSTDYAAAIREMKVRANTKT